MCRRDRFDVEIEQRDIPVQVDPVFGRSSRINRVIARGRIVAVAVIQERFFRQIGDQRGDVVAAVLQVVQLQSPCPVGDHFLLLHRFEHGRLWILRQHVRSYGARACPDGLEERLVSLMGNDRYTLCHVGAQPARVIVMGMCINHVFDRLVRNPFLDFFVDG